MSQDTKKLQEGKDSKFNLNMLSMRLDIHVAIVHMVCNTDNRPVVHKLGTLLGTSKYMISFNLSTL